MTTWRKELAEAMADLDPGPVIAYAPDEAAFDIKFDGTFGIGPEVLAWTEANVYFPVVSPAGSMWMESVPRNPTKDTRGFFGG